MVTIDTIANKVTRHLALREIEDIRLFARAALRIFPTTTDEMLLDDGHYILREWLTAQTGSGDNTGEKGERFVAVFQSTINADEWLLSFKGAETGQNRCGNVDYEFAEFPFLRARPSANLLMERGCRDVYVAPVVAEKGDAFISLQRQLFNFLNARAPKILNISGHGVGSAIAAVFMYDVLKCEGLKKPEVIKLINFACPKVLSYEASVDFRNYLNEKYTALRVVNTNDVVAEASDSCDGNDDSCPFYFATDYLNIKF